MIDKRNLYRLPWSMNDNAIAWLEITDICNIYCEGCYRQRLTGHKTLEEVKEEEEEASFEEEDHPSVPSTEELSRELDRRLERLEQQHLRRTSFLESAIFSLQLCTDLLTVAHFLHIWSLHGVQFTLIDGVLALHETGENWSVARAVWLGAGVPASGAAMIDSLSSVDRTRLLTLTF